MKTFMFFINHPLNKKSRLRAFFRIFYWQAKSVRQSRAFVIDWVNHSQFYARKGETGVTGNIYSGLHEFSDMAFLLHFLRPNDKFIDVGANSGSYTVLAGKVIGAEVLSFEPLPTAYKRLLNNIELNGISANVVAFNIGISSALGVLKFSDDLDTMNRIVTNEYSGKSSDVRVMSLDEAAANFDPILIKIDVEGFESQVLSGAKNILRSTNLLGIIVELNGSGMKYGFSDENSLDILEANGFLPYSYLPFERKIMPISRTDFREGNIIFLRGLNEVTRRVESAQKFQVLKQFI